MKHYFLPLALNLCLAITATAQHAGTPDSSFGNNGTVLREDLTGEYNKVIPLADGRMVTTRIQDSVAYLSLYNSNATNRPVNQLRLPARLQGGVGLVNGSIAEVKPLADGTILIAGVAYKLYGTVFIEKFKRNGEPDSSFGNNGRVTYSDGDFASVKGLVLQPDNKILFSMLAVYDGVPEIDIPTLLRYNSDGTPDSSFGTNGKTTKIIGNYLQALQSDGKIILATSSRGTLLFNRLKPNGVTDSSFGTNGRDSIVIWPSGSLNSVFMEDMMVQADDKIVAAVRNDYYAPSSLDILLARLNADGTPDEDFGNGGLVQPPFTQGIFRDPITLLQQPDGKLLIGATTRYLVPPYNRDSSLVIRLQTNGRPDVSFGDHGYTKAFLPGGDGYRITSMALQPDGKIVISGTWIEYDANGNYLTNHPTMARYLNDIGTAVSATEGNMLQENVVHSFTVYPNPVRSQINISTKGTATFNLYSAGGSLLVSKTISNTGNIPVANIANGYYYLKNTKTGEVKKILVTK